MPSSSGLTLPFIEVSVLRLKTVMIPHKFPPLGTFPFLILAFCIILISRSTLNKLYCYIFVVWYKQIGVQNKHGDIHIAWSMHCSRCKKYFHCILVIFNNYAELWHNNKKLKKRVREHMANTRKGIKDHSVLKHFTLVHHRDPSKVRFGGIEKVTKHRRGSNYIRQISQRKFFWIYETSPLGYQHIIWSELFH